jgi:hypothetical protein
MPEPDLFQASLDYQSGGRAVLPPVAQRAKFPSILNEHGKIQEVRWKIHTEQRPSTAQLRAWFGNGTLVGIAIAGGYASKITLEDGTRTGAEFLDIEDEEIANAYVSLVTARGYRALLDRLPWEEPPRGGVHTG